MENLKMSSFVKLVRVVIQDKVLKRKDLRSATVACAKLYDVRERDINHIVAKVEKEIKYKED